MVLKFDKITQNPELPVVWMYVSLFYQRTQQIFCDLPAPKCRRSLEPNSINTLHIMSRPFVVVWLDCVFRCRLFVFFSSQVAERTDLWTNTKVQSKNTHTHTHMVIDCFLPVILVRLLSNGYTHTNRYTESRSPSAIAKHQKRWICKRTNPGSGIHNNSISVKSVLVLWKKKPHSHRGPHSLHQYEGSDNGPICYEAPATSILSCSSRLVST